MIVRFEELQCCKLRFSMLSFHLQSDDVMVTNLRGHRGSASLAYSQRAHLASLYSFAINETDGCYSRFNY